MQTNYNYDFCKWNYDDNFDNMDVKTIETKIEMLKNNKWKYIRDSVIATYKGKDNIKANSLFNKTLGLIYIIGIVITAFALPLNIPIIIILFGLYELIKINVFTFASLLSNYPYTMELYKRVIRAKQKEIAVSEKKRLENNLDNNFTLQIEESCTSEETYNKPLKLELTRKLSDNQ